MKVLRLTALILLAMVLVPLPSSATCQDCDQDFFCSSPRQGSPGFEECESRDSRNCDEGGCAGYRFCIARVVCGSQPFRVIEVQVPQAAQEAVAGDFPHLGKLLSMVLTTGEFRGELSAETHDGATETLRFEGWLQRALGNHLTLSFQDHPTLTAVSVEWSGSEWEAVVLADWPHAYSSKDAVAGR